ncbi:hypothetical protein JM18_009393 [Phytophthora kernoviae]|uniref:Uncharacterized protein n=1 Tax=Phytophthora kernoviae TaxID=325452 RepID=A0A921S9E9_9STRA|nr:hypothetical protein JM18_009393 [Phytophthora kernoviae]
MSDDSSDTVVVDEDDVNSERCNVCVLGSRHPEIPPPSTVNLLSLGDPDPRFDAIVCDANTLECENRVLRSRLELSTALNAGLAAHASILHDRSLSILSRAREGFDLGTATVSRLYDQLDRLRAEDTRLRDELATVRAQADRADSFETRYFALEKTTTEETHAAQDALDRERARVAQLSARLSTTTSNLATTPVTLQATTTAPVLPFAASTDIAVNTAVPLPPDDPAQASGMGTSSVGATPVPPASVAVGVYGPRSGRVRISSGCVDHQHTCVGRCSFFSSYDVDPDFPVVGKTRVARPTHIEGVFRIAYRYPSFAFRPIFADAFSPF